MNMNLQFDSESTLTTRGASGCISTLLCCLWFVGGCGGDLPTLAPVSGIVELDGAPISEFKNAAVSFTPQGGQLAKSTIDPKDGSFELWTYKEGDGAIVGPAKITVRATVDDPNANSEDKYPGVRWVIPDKFSDRDLSGLTCDVVPGEKNFFRIKISSDGTGTVEME
ncbi:MAG: hypothetical protein ACR2NU_05340 [Aeoliella sp.]